MIHSETIYGLSRRYRPLRRQILMNSTNILRKSIIGTTSCPPCPVVGSRTRSHRLLLKSLSQWGVRDRSLVMYLQPLITCQIRHLDTTSDLSRRRQPSCRQISTYSIYSLKAGMAHDPRFQLPHWSDGGVTLGITGPDSLPFNFYGTQDSLDLDLAS